MHRSFMHNNLHMFSSGSQKGPACELGNGVCNGVCFATAPTGASVAVTKHTCENSVVSGFVFDP